MFNRAPRGPCADQGDGVTSREYPHVVSQVADRMIEFDREFPRADRLGIPHLPKDSTSQRALGSTGRLRAYRAGQLSAADVAIWVGLYPQEVPTINGEFEWLAANAE